MGAMKAIYTETQELQFAAMGDEESFMNYVGDMGWTSPTEREIHTARAMKFVRELPDPSVKEAALKLLKMVGVDTSAIELQSTPAVSLAMSA